MQAANTSGGATTGLLLRIFGCRRCWRRNGVAHARRSVVDSLAALATLKALGLRSSLPPQRQPEALALVVLEPIFLFYLFLNILFNILFN